jgi:uncharacterized protein with HEPN domain
VADTASFIERGICKRCNVKSNWVIHHLEIIGEAARAIPQEFKDWTSFSVKRRGLIYYFLWAA